MTAEDYESFYTDLEWMFYDLHLSLTTIYDYLGDQFTTPSIENKGGRFSSFLTSSILDEHSLSGREAFPMWRHYLHLCQKLGWTDYTPQRFISAYNFALEASGLEPILYRPLKDYTRYCSRVVPGTNGKTCRKVGAHEREKEKQKTETAAREYKRTYNRLKARKRRGQITVDEWNRQVVQAQELKDAFTAQQMTKDEYVKRLYEL